MYLSLISIFELDNKSLTISGFLLKTAKCNAAI